MDLFLNIICQQQTVNLFNLRHFSMIIRKQHHLGAADTNPAKAAAGKSRVI
jgi:hypothetical protein